MVIGSAVAGVQLLMDDGVVDALRKCEFNRRRWVHQMVSKVQLSVNLFLFLAELPTKIFFLLPPNESFLEKKIRNDTI